MPFPKGLVDAVAGEAENILRDTAIGLGQSPAEFIANGEPSSIIGKINQDTLRRLCRRWAANPGDYSATVSTNNDATCRPYLEDIGQYPGQPTATNGFRGGQCAIVYNVRGGGYNIDTPPLYFPQGNINVLGPIQGLKQLGGNSWVIVHNDGQETFWGQPLSSTWIDTVTPVTPGQEDNCGDGPSTFTPPTGVGPDPGPPEIISPAPGFDVTLDVDITEEGDITITIGGEPSEPFNPYLPEPEPENDPTNPDFPGDTGEPGSSDDTGVGGEAEGEDEDKYLVGVKINVLAYPPRANIRHLGDVTIWKGAGYVYLGGDAGLDLQPEGSYLQDGQFFFAPKGSNKYRVSANFGYNLRVTPYWKDAE